MIKLTNTSNSNPDDQGLGKGWNYEAKVAEVERIITQIEAGKLELEEVFDKFATAVEYLQECENFLQSSQQKVDLLIETLKDE
jgi:exodeoxyribonuclease VII small subunit